VLNPETHYQAMPYVPTPNINGNGNGQRPYAPQLPEDETQQPRRPGKL
jgi:hypothetical protein